MRIMLYTQSIWGIHVSTAEVWLCIAPIMDLCARKIIGLSMYSYITAELVADALEQAIARRTLTRGTILYSDRGV